MCFGARCAGGGGDERGEPAQAESTLGLGGWKWYPGNQHQTSAVCADMLYCISFNDIWLKDFGDVLISCSILINTPCLENKNVFHAFMTKVPHLWNSKM